MARTLRAPPLVYIVRAPPRHFTHAYVEHTIRLRQLGHYNIYHHLHQRGLSARYGDAVACYGARAGLVFEANNDGLMRTLAHVEDTTDNAAFLRFDKNVYSLCGSLLSSTL